MGPQQADEGVVFEHPRSQQRQEKRGVGDHWHRARSQIFWRHGDSEHHQYPATNTQDDGDTQSRESQGGPVRPGSCVHSWHGRQEQDAKRPNQPRGWKQTQCKQGDGKVRHWKKVSASHTIARSHSTLDRRGNDKENHGWQRVSKQGIEQRRAVKPSIRWTRTRHPKITGEGEGKERERPEQQHRIDARKLAFGCWKDGHDPIIVLRQFRHPPQSLEVGVQIHQIGMDIFRLSFNTPRRPTASVFSKHIEVILKGRGKKVMLRPCLLLMGKSGGSVRAQFTHSQAPLVIVVRPLPHESLVRDRKEVHLFLNRLSRKVSSRSISSRRS